MGSGLGVPKEKAIATSIKISEKACMGFVVGVRKHSYRFGEVLSRQDSVLVDTDCVLPYEHLIDWNKHAIIVNENDDIANVIIEFHKNTNEETLINMQKQNRKLWKITLPHFLLLNT